MLEGLLFLIKVGCVSVVKKDPKTYEHIDPKEVVIRNIIISNQAEDLISYQDWRTME